jgi:hypothetical protein
MFSPDVRWLAYTSRASGRNEVYIRSFPDSTKQIPVSTNGGGQARWQSDGKEIYYCDENDQLVAANVTLLPGTIKVGVPRPLLRVAGLPSGTTHYAVFDKGERFLVRSGTGEGAFTVVVNWLSSLKYAAH